MCASYSDAGVQGIQGVLAGSASGTSSEPEVLVGCGFWLPCGRSNFFDSNRDEKLLDYYNLAQAAAVMDPAATRTPTGRRLQVSVYRRLTLVLANKGYTHAIPIIPKFRKPYSDPSEPDAAVFLHGDPATAKPEEWPISSTASRIVLLVTADGFYLWLAKCATHQFLDVVQQIHGHILAIAGSEKYHGCDTYKPIHPHDHLTQMTTLEDYCKQCYGILNFFQLNSILEGLSNFTFDVQVFFTREQTSVPNDILEEYSLNSFMQRITADSITPRTIDPARHLCITAAMDGIFDLSRRPQYAVPSAPGNDGHMEDIAKTLLDTCIEHGVRRDLLRQFLRRTTTFSLQSLKWGIETCRRTLLADVISVTNSKSDMYQLVSPDLETHLGFANEDQLRGYVMLISAKLPLVANVGIYLNEAWDGMPLKEQSDIRALKDSWTTLFSSINHNLDELENAIDQARSERTLYEQEQIRAEQEAVAEVERINNRMGIGSPSSDQPPRLAHAINIILLWTLVVTVVVLAISDYSASVASPGSILGLGNVFRVFFTPNNLLITALLIVLPIVAYLIFVYLIRPRGFEQGRLRLYEMDMRIDEDIQTDCAVATYLGDIPCKHCLKASGRQGQPSFSNIKIRKVECSTYRVDRRAIDEAVHKVHTELTVDMPSKSITLPSGRGPWGWVRRYVHARRAPQQREIKLFLVYEILFHRPSDEPGYMLRELRVIAPYFQVLDEQDVLELKKFVLEHLVHKKLPMEIRVDQNFDSLLSLNVR